MAIKLKRKASDAAVGESPIKRVTRLHPSHLANAAIGDKIVAARQTAAVTPRGKTRRSFVADSTPTRPRTRNTSPDSEDELNDNLREPESPLAVADLPRTRSGKVELNDNLRKSSPADDAPRTRSGKVRVSRSPEKPRPTLVALGQSADSMEDIPTPPPSPSKRSTMSSPAKPPPAKSPTKPTPRKTSSPAKRRLKARTPTPVSDSEEESPEPLLPGTSSSQASSPIEIIPPVEETDSTASPSVHVPSSPSTNKLQFISSQHCLSAQKREILRAIQDPPDLADEEEESTNQTALKQLSDLLQGTVARGEGNSCLLLGPRGSGKTRIANQCLRDLPEQPIVLRLCGWSQQSDRLAMREIAYQLTQQTGKSFLTAPDDDVPTGAEDADEENPFLDTPSKPVTMALPPSTHLPALISLLHTLSRPTVVILDAFDLFAQHPRQSLLYCLLDTAQSCRAGEGSKGIAVIGMTTRVDTVNLLEKRVKSRFSGRTLRTAAPSQSQDWIELARGILCSKIKAHEELKGIEIEEWHQQWEAGVQSFLQDETTISILRETFSVTKDVRVLARLLTSIVIQLSPSSPYPMSSQLAAAAAIQRSRARFPMLHALPYPSICLLIACVHSETAGHLTFTFEMLYERVRDQIRFSSSAPVEINGSSIGMPKCPRSVLMSAFESLMSARIVAPTVAPSASVGKEFVRFRAVVSREDVKKAVQTRNDINLSKWLTKAQ
ncbi:origin recognition complex subunit 4 C-terminus-domain-containing protein [Mycena galopus ATCC 62051]|nr:origin recognition complex subunit 4 C-terminus-domain-containing protein [Mycena galopus ATCC 62051]